MKSFTVYTDGGCWPNPGKGGWGVHIIDDETGEVTDLCGAVETATNNTMELTAALMAMRHFEEPTAITLYTDSQYLSNGITKWVLGWKAIGWQRKGKDGAPPEPIANVEIWKALDAAREKHQIEWKWVRGHSGNAGNERADELARQGMEQEPKSYRKEKRPAPKEAPICPYCGKLSRLISSTEIYQGRDFGMLYACKPCEAWVGVHSGTEKPLGRLANKELREWKQKAHAAFDPIWEEKYRRRLRERGEEYKKFFARGSAYKWLAEQLEITSKECHIGLFDVDRCKKVVELCEPIRAKLTITKGYNYAPA